MLRVYNTLTRTKEPFEPVQPGKVGIYLCGPTVYKPSHIGHMVGPVIFDAVKRWLTYSGYKVRLVVNITDVDDKLIAESNKRGMPMAQLAAEMTADYMANLAALGVDVIDHFPKCTETIDEIVKFTETLIEKGFAYEAQGDVYFEVSKFDGYGKLSHRGLEAMRGEGGGMADRKRSSADFALWKSAKPGEPSWPSPWGDGRPGWHIECSAMSRKLLGESFDIHGGGLDLMFPHHENEVAQSECCHGKPMAKYWMHNGLMQASSEVGKLGGRNTRPAEGDLAAQEAGKISKSKGSAPFRDMLKQFSGETIRFFVLSTQYRRPIDYSEERLHEIETGMETFYRFFKRFERIAGESYYALPISPLARPTGEGPGVRAEGRRRPQRRRRDSQSLFGRHGRRFQHRRRHWRAVRSGACVEQVCRRRKARRRGETHAGECRDVAPRRFDAPRIDRRARAVPPSGRGKGARRRRSDRQVDEAVDRAKGRSPQEEGFRHGRSDSQHLGRAWHCVGRPARRNGVEPEVVVSG